MIHIVLAEDHQILSDGIMAFLEHHPNLQILEIVSNGEALLQSVDKHQPDVVITDVRMPKMDGIEATIKIRAQYPQIKVVVLSMFDQYTTIQQALKAGADAYVLKNSGLKTLVLAVEQAMSGNQFLDPNLSLNLLHDLSETQNMLTEKGILSMREKEILHYIAQGKTTIEIASLLFVSKSTIDTHRKNMMRKLEIVGSNSLLHFALENKFK
jgi:two-component system, NarL family, response regulator NreC